MKFYSWGLNQKTNSNQYNLDLHQLKPLNSNPNSYLVRGQGRSYGDVCLNDKNNIIHLPLPKETQERYHFDPEHLVFTGHASMTINEVLPILVSKNCFLHVTPGTSFATLGGCVANDVHGKNHHKVGSFCHFVGTIKLMRSDGKILLCSRSENPELFHATMGGLGLTGIILYVSIIVKKIPSPFVEVHSIKFRSYSEFQEINEKQNKSNEFTVSWFDTSHFIKTGDFRGLHYSGNFCQLEHKFKLKRLTPFFNLPCRLPNIFSHTSILNFANTIYYLGHENEPYLEAVDYNKYFYPLDIIGNWNKFYGKHGFYQMQCLIPSFEIRLFLNEIRLLLKKYNSTSFVTVLKAMGDREGVGYISFAKKGMTLCMDFPGSNPHVKEMMKKLYDIVFKYDGRINPAKDSFMTKEQFEVLWKDKDKFIKNIDPLLSSNFSRRVGIRL